MSNMLIKYQKYDDDLFVLTYDNIKFAYAYKQNLLRKIEDNPYDVVKKEQLRSLNIFDKQEFESHPWEDHPGILIGVTSSCNLHCSYCHVSGGDYTETLTPEMTLAIKRYIAKGISKKPKSFKIHFHSDGESLMRQNIVEDFINYAEAIKGNTEIHYNLVTNGTLITDRNINLLKKIHNIQISLDGVPEIHDKNRGLSKLTIDAIKLLVENKLNVSIRATLDHDGLKHMPEFIDMLSVLFEPTEDHPLYLGAGPIYQGERDIDQADIIDPHFFVLRYLEAKHYAKSKNIKLVNSNENANLPKNKFCMATDGVFFAPSGVVSSCVRISRESNDRASEFIYGKFDKDHYEIDEEAYKNLHSLRNVPETCLSCPVLTLCGGSTCYLTRESEYYCAIRIQLLLLQRLIASTELERL